MCKKYHKIYLKIILFLYKNFLVKKYPLLIFKLNFISESKLMEFEKDIIELLSIVYKGIDKTFDKSTVVKAIIRSSTT